MQEEHSLIANSGIQIFTFPLTLNLQEREKLWFYERFDEDSKKWLLDLVYELRSDDSIFYYTKKDLFKGGYLNDPSIEFSESDLKDDGILPLRVDDVNMDGVDGCFFPMGFADRNCKIKAFENVWLPVPYFTKRTERKFDFAPMNWARMKLVPKAEADGRRSYDVVLAFDTRAEYEAADEYMECPFFPSRYTGHLDFALCGDEFKLMDYCTSGQSWSYIDDYLFHLAYPGLDGLDKIVGSKERRMAYVATYVYLIGYLAKRGLSPKIRLFRDSGVAAKSIDMIVDIGNSRTTALLVEDNSNFNQVCQLGLVDFTELTNESGGCVSVNRHNRPFDMRLAFRKVDFGGFGIKDSRQFVYPSLVRLGDEANRLIRQSVGSVGNQRSLSTYSSPKRYLWDSHVSKGEWEFLVLEGENPSSHILKLQGITNQLNADGTIDPDGNGGSTSRYSRRSLMTFSFLEMFAQAVAQINSEEYRVGRGEPDVPRRLKRVIVTCPTAMSKVEREALVGCAHDAAVLLGNFIRGGKGLATEVEVVPSVSSRGGSSGGWYYDEATCSQLVYMFGEAGNKYKGCCDEFFNLYGKKADGDERPSITVGSVDIGAGTSDLMVCKYSYDINSVATITPDPKFYDSFYFAGDDILYALVKNAMILGDKSAFRREMSGISPSAYRQRMKDFFGEDYNGQTYADRRLRRDFNLQYSVPLMCHFLELLKNRSGDCIVSYDDVFADCRPSPSVLSGFMERTGIDVMTLQWQFVADDVAAIVRKEFEPMLKKIATVMYSYACDVILLSGRPASLPIIREIFLKYYPVSPNRLLLLNDYYVGDWYPFGDNTGYVTNSKTIVAVGAAIGFYASSLPVLDNFVLDLSKLNEGLASTANYVSTQQDRRQTDFLLSPGKCQGELIVSSLPARLTVRQIGMASYPGRELYSVDFNTRKMAERLRKKAAISGESVTDSQIASQVDDSVEALKRRMPLRVAIGREGEDKETLSILSVSDKNGDDVTDSNLEVNIQSMGAADEYWLDNGAFDF
ncbi:MAG: virulence factor SrfB [Marinilabiliaceae bacterium]